MARNGSGVYSNPYPNFVAGTVISSTEVDANNTQMATALTQSIAVDGQTTVTANLPMNSNKFTTMAVGSAATDSLTLGQAQGESFIWCGTAGGAADALTLSPSPAITSYVAGQRFAWKASTNTNTGAATVAISGLSTIALQADRTALAAGDHVASDIYMGLLDTTSTIQVLKWTSIVASAEIADGSVTLAKMATLADSTLIVGDGSGAPVAESGATLRTSIGVGTTDAVQFKTVLANTDTDTSNTGSVTLDFAAHQNFVLTFTGNVVLANPSTEAVGQAGVIVCIQDGTGGRGLTFGTDYESAGGAGITLSTAGNAVDIIPYFVKATGSILLGAPQLAFS